MELFYQLWCLSDRFPINLANGFMNLIYVIFLLLQLLNKKGLLTHHVNADSRAELIKLYIQLLSCLLLILT